MPEDRVRALLQEIKDACQASLGADLTGVYVHGSLGFGCFRWEVSDVDFLVVADAPPVASTADLLRRLAVIDAHGPPKGLEASLLLRRDCAVIDHPVPFLMHYSPAYRDTARTDPVAYAAQPVRRDPDLAAHIMVLHQVGFALCGPPVADVFGQVPRAAYWDSILLDIRDAEASIAENPVYIILNLCRVLAYGQEGLVLSKAKGGEWALAHLPAEYHVPVRAALSAYAGRAEPSLAMPPETLHAFAEWMLQRIRSSSKRFNRKTAG